tara:strand:+ start:1756 stop:3933 length:2178 start_codon:yes stop_codon:yes gene_type:complete
MVDNTDITNSKEEENQEKEQEANRLASFVYEKFDSSERARQSDEDRWLEAFHNYRGKYYKNVHFREHEKSRVFVKVTKTKVLAAYGQLIDVLFSANKFPISVEETKVPEGASEYAHLNPVGENLQKSGPSIEGGPDQSEQTMSPEQMSLVGFEGDGRELPKGATFNGLSENKEFLGSLKDELGDKSVQEGSAPLPEMAQIRPATTLARRMEKLIHDEIDESSGSQELRSAIFESCLLGTGIIKGPFTFNKTLHRYVKNEDGTRSYQPEQVKVPRLEFVSAWDFYPDPNAKNIEECEYVVHRHKLNKNQLRDLLDRPFFDKDAVIATLEDGPNYRNRTFETQIKNEDSYQTQNDRFEILEFWGCVDKQVLEDSQIPVPEGMDDEKELQINAWVTENRVLRMVVNPFKPYRIPYNAFPYEKNPYSFFGIGVPENMNDAQQIMNGHARMAIDNLALSGSLVFDVDESALVAGQTMDVYPGKIFRRQAGMPGQAIHGLKFPNTSTENMMMFDKFRQLADESTGIPSYSHGQTGVQSMTRTASGMSMLLSAANLNIKTVVKNLDDFLLKPLGEAYFQWNMQFYEGDLAIEGDLEVKATGTSSLMQKEVRSQRLTMFLQSVQNPAIAPFVKIPELIKELAYTLDLDPETVINDPNEAEIYAKIIGLQNARPNQSVGGTDSPESPMAAPQGVPIETPEPDNSGVGNGTIGTGSVPQTGEMEFTGTVNPTGQN